ncbi:MAG: sigma-54-dependent transcriptional regulator [Calditrichia bacterium]
MPFSVHIVDDEKNIRRSLELILRPKRYRVKTFESGTSFLENLPNEQPDAVLLDVNLGDMDGIDVLRKLKELSPHTEVVMISGHATLSTAVEATHAGAYDFLEKPLQKEKILITLRHIKDRHSLQTKVHSLQTSVDDGYQIIGESAGIRQIQTYIEKVAPTDSKVLITGESGVGKELVAYAVHKLSNCADGPFVKMNCAAIPEDLIESELFGNEKGAFTGATERREGKFQQADGGSLFLDEVGDMSLRVQTKVLRVLQDGEFQRVGGKDTLKAEVRVIAATNRDLEEMVKEGTFREDLYFRLNVLPIEVPPLRERADDVPLLIAHFVQRYCRKNNRREMRVEAALEKALQAYQWPGNIRELQNLVERLIILADGEEIKKADLPASYLSNINPTVSFSPGSRTLAEVREEAERTYILACLESSDGNVSQAARMLGMERTNLHKKMKSLGIR